MAKAGDVIINGEERILFRQTAVETSGELLEVEVTYKPHSKRPPEHYHPRQEERFELLSGILAAKIGDQEFRYEPGDQFVVPPGTPHWMHNISMACANRMYGRNAQPGDLLIDHIAE